jgi:hypothetical protein
VLDDDGGNDGNDDDDYDGDKSVGQKNTTQKII